MNSTSPRGVSDSPEGDVTDWAGRIRELCIRELAALPPDGLVVDVCSGEGGVARTLLPQGRMVGVEYSWERCRRSLGRVTMVRGDACRLPLRDGCASAVFFFEGIEHLPEPGRALADIHRILKPEGSLFISTPNTVWISLRRLRDYGALRPEQVRHSHLREWSYGFPAFLARHGYRVERRTSPDPLGIGWYRRARISVPERLRWLMGCTQLVIARRV